MSTGGNQGSSKVSFQDNVRKLAANARLLTNSQSEKVGITYQHKVQRKRGSATISENERKFEVLSFRTVHRMIYVAHNRNHVNTTCAAGVVTTRPIGTYSAISDTQCIHDAIVGGKRKSCNGNKTAASTPPSLVPGRPLIVVTLGISSTRTKTTNVDDKILCATSAVIRLITGKSRDKVKILLQRRACSKTSSAICEMIQNVAKMLVQEAESESRILNSHGERGAPFSLDLRNYTLLLFVSNHTDFDYLIQSCPKFFKKNNFLTPIYIHNLKGSSTRAHGHLFDHQAAQIFAALSMSKRLKQQHSSFGWLVDKKPLTYHTLKLEASKGFTSDFNYLKCANIIQAKLGIDIRRLEPKRKGGKSYKLWRATMTMIFGKAHEIVDASHVLSNFDGEHQNTKNVENKAMAVIATKKRRIGIENSGPNIKMPKDGLEKKELDVDGERSNIKTAEVKLEEAALRDFAVQKNNSLANVGTDKCRTEIEKSDLNINILRVGGNAKNEMDIFDDIWV